MIGKGSLGDQVGLWVHLRGWSRNGYRPSVSCVGPSRRLTPVVSFYFEMAGSVRSVGCPLPKVSRGG